MIRLTWKTGVTAAQDRHLNRSIYSTVYPVVARDAVGIYTSGFTVEKIIHPKINSGEIVPTATPKEYVITAVGTLKEVYTRIPGIDSGEIVPTATPKEYDITATGALTDIYTTLPDLNSGEIVPTATPKEYVITANGALVRKGILYTHDRDRFTISFAEITIEEIP